MGWGGGRGKSVLGAIGAKICSSKTQTKLSSSWALGEALPGLEGFGNPSCLTVWLTEASRTGR